jgi:hypothetical protein
MKSNDFPVFLYVIEDPREPGHIRYIGATVSLSSRYSRHQQAAIGNQREDVPLYSWWRALLSEGVEPTMRLLWQGTKEQRADAEIRAIAGYRKLGFCLLNQTNGGPGMLGYAFTQESRDRMSKGSRKGKAKRSKRPGATAWMKRRAEILAERAARESSVS